MNYSPLNSTQALAKLEEFGFNEIISGKKNSALKMFIREFTDLMVIILMIASIIAILSGENVDGYVILFIVILNAIIGFIQEYRADKAIQALQKLVAPKARILRDNKEIIIDAKYVVPGDILILNEGDKIVADGKILEAHNLNINESILTGESNPVIKTNKIDATDLSLTLVFMSTEVTSGTAKVLVEKTGMHSRFGEIAKLTTETKKDKSPLEKELFRIGLFVSKITFVISAFLLVIGIFVQGKNFVDTLLFAVSVAVAAVPEGLPATITIALALGVQKLAKKNAITKQLSSVETLGSTTVICSDKTGTLTKNEMTVDEFKSWSDAQVDFEISLKAMYLCQNSKLSDEKYIGDPTEIALLRYSLEENKNYKIDFEKYERIDEIPFDSQRKMMSVVVNCEIAKHKCIFTKGAAEKVLDNCKFILKNEQQLELTEEMKKEILAKIEEMSNKALRVLALAYKEIPDNIESSKDTESNLVFLSLVGLIDPPRLEVPNAISQAKKAGIKIHIITGDHPLTAKAIASKIGLKIEQLITGDELNKISEEQLIEILKTKESIIFARVNPEDKLRITNALKQNGEIVAVTGDGVNDAPALKRADIGIAMGITGTDVSKEAANMVLADDSFASIVSAIKEGRKIYENLKKFVFYVFSCNIGELTTVFAAIIFQLPAPLTAVLILAVDIGTDVLPAIAIGVEDSEEGIMEKAPRNPNAKIMTKKFVIHFVVLGLIIGAIVLGVYLFELNRSDYARASTMAFVMLVMIQMFNAFNCRSLTESVFKMGFFKNKHLMIAVLISTIFAVSVTQFEFFHNYLGTTYLNINEWLLIALASVSILVIEEVRKFFQRIYL